MEQTPPLICTDPSTWFYQMTIAQRVIEVLAAAPQGLTTREVCLLVGGNFASTAARLSTLASHGRIEREMVTAPVTPSAIHCIWRPKAAPAEPSRAVTWAQLERVPR